MPNAPTPNAPTPSPTTPTQVLRTVFGYQEFRGAQAEVIDTVVGGGDALVLMPTGGGKSLCYQIPALVRPGTGVVVSPADRAHAGPGRRASALGVRAGLPQLHPGRDAAPRTIERALLAGELDLLYLAPSASWSAAPWPCWTRAGSRCSRSTRRTACRSGGTTSGRTTCSCTCCTSSGPTCRGSRSPRPRRAPPRAEITERLALRRRAAPSSRASTGPTSPTASSRRTTRAPSCCSCCAPSTRATRASCTACRASPSSRPRSS